MQCRLSPLCAYLTPDRGEAGSALIPGEFAEPETGDIALPPVAMGEDECGAGWRGGGIEVHKREAWVGGYPVRYEVAGEGEPVVLVYGLSGSTRWWAGNVPALAERHRVYLVDLPGFGAMRRLRRRFVLAEAASWLSAWMEAVGLEQADVVGHSMGGYISLRLAAQRPEAVRRLVLVAPAVLPAGQSLLGQVLPLLLSARHMKPSFLPVVTGDALRMGPVTLWRTARDLLRGDVREEVRSVRAPTLLIWGENDTLVPPTIGHLLRREIPDSRLLIMEKAGHVPMFDRPRKFDAALLTFLTGEVVGE